MHKAPGSSVLSSQHHPSEAAPQHMRDSGCGSELPAESRSLAAAYEALQLPSIAAAATGSALPSPKPAGTSEQQQQQDAASDKHGYSAGVAQESGPGQHQEGFIGSGRFTPDQLAVATALMVVLKSVIKTAQRQPLQQGRIWSATTQPLAPTSICCRLLGTAGSCSHCSMWSRKLSARFSRVSPCWPSSARRSMFSHWVSSCAAWSA